jgi:hypothetical protein
MFLANPTFGERASKQAHLDRQSKTIFAAHRAQNPELHGLSSRTGVG